jgi:hypothetical protein
VLHSLCCDSGELNVTAKIIIRLIHKLTEHSAALKKKATIVKKLLGWALINSVAV